MANGRENKGWSAEVKGGEGMESKLVRGEEGRGGVDYQKVSHARGKER